MPQKPTFGRSPRRSGRPPDLLHVEAEAPYGSRRSWTAWTPASIQTRVMLLVVAGALGTLVVTWWVAALRCSSVRADREVLMESVTRSLASDLELRLGWSLEHLQGLASAIRAVDADAAAGAALVHRAYVGARFLDAVFVLDAGGRMQWSDPAEAVVLVAARPAPAARPTVTTLVHTPQGDAIYLQVPFRAWDGTPWIAGGVMVIGSHRFAAFAAPVTGHELPVTLRDRQARVIARSRGANAVEASSSSAPPFTRALAMAPWSIDVPDEPAGPVSPWELEMGAGVLLLAVLFAWGAARSVRHPLLRLTRTAEAIAAGDLESPVPALGADEIGRLARALADMRDHLVRSLGELSTANEQLEGRVAARTRELEHLYGELRERDRIRLALLRRVLDAQEGERRRLARELHDDTCQTVAAIRMRLETALANWSGAPAHVEEARALAGRSLEGLRRMMTDLRPSMLDDLGLLAAIEWFAEHRLRRMGTSVRFEVGTFPERLSYEVETTLFRAAQEVLSNVARHAEADAVLVQCSAVDGRVTLEIEDDGRGFDVDEIRPRPDDWRGLGLLGLRERLELVGGCVLIESAPGRGTRVVLTAPLLEAAA